MAISYGYGPQHSGQPTIVGFGSVDDAIEKAKHYLSRVKVWEDDETKCIIPLYKDMAQAGQIKPSWVKIGEVIGLYDKGEVSTYAYL